MKKLLVVLLLTLFTVGITSCGTDATETDPVIPEVQVDGPGSDVDEEEEEEGSAGPVKN